MKPRGVFLLAVVLCAATHVMAQPARTLQADRIAEKLWWIIDITKEYQPQFQAHVTLEAPDGERLALSFPGESARTLVRDDVIALERQPEVPVDAPEPARGASFIPHLATWGKPRWWSERAKHEGVNSVARRHQFFGDRWHHDYCQNALSKTLVFETPLSAYQNRSDHGGERVSSTLLASEIKRYCPVSYGDLSDRMCLIGRKRGWATFPKRDVFGNVYYKNYYRNSD